MNALNSSILKVVGQVDNIQTQISVENADIGTLASLEYPINAIIESPVSKEIVVIESFSDSLITVIRGQQSTSAVSFPTGSLIVIGLTALDISNIINSETRTVSQCPNYYVTPNYLGEIIYQNGGLACQKKVWIAVSATEARWQIIGGYSCTNSEDYQEQGWNWHGEPTPPATPSPYTGFTVLGRYLPGDIVLSGGNISQWVPSMGSFGNLVPTGRAIPFLVDTYGGHQFAKCSAPAGSQYNSWFTMESQAGTVSFSEFVFVLVWGFPSIDWSVNSLYSEVVSSSGGIGAYFQATVREPHGYMELYGLQNGFWGSSYTSNYFDIPGTPSLYVSLIRSSRIKNNTTIKPSSNSPSGSDCNSGASGGSLFHLNLQDDVKIFELAVINGPISDAQMTTIYNNVSALYA